MSYGEKIHLFLQCCKAGNLKDAKEVHNKGNVQIDYNNHQPLHVACAFGKLDVAKWIFGLSQPVPFKILQSVFFQSCIRDRKEVVQWLYEEVNGIEIIPLMLIHTAFNGHLNIVKYLCKKRDFSKGEIQEAINEAYGYREMEVVDYLTKRKAKM